MTKKEQAEMDRLRSDLALARAMRWPTYPAPAPMTREQIEANKVEGGQRFGRAQRVARGWFYHAYLGGYGTPDVTLGCSDGLYHSTEGNVTSSQHMGRMYATRAEALQALRIDLTEQCAKVLAHVDRLLASDEAS